MNATSGSDIAVQSSDFSINSWQHVAVTRLSGTVRLYINGLLKDTGTAEDDMNNTNAVNIGYKTYTSSSYNYFTGYMSNFRILKGTAAYTDNSFTVPASALTAISNTKLLTCQNAAGTTVTNGAYNFTSGSARLTASSSDFNFTNSNPFTYEMWYKFTARSNADCMFDFGNGNTFQMYVYNNEINIYGLGGGFVIQFGSDGYALDTWYHVAITGDGSSNVKAYVDGTQVGSTYASPGWNITGSRFRFNGYAGSGYTTIGITGLYSDVRFVKGTQVYTGNFTRPSGPLTTTGGTYPSTTNVNTSIPAGHTKLLTAQNSSGSHVDNSASGHTFTEDGTVTPTTGVVVNDTTDASSSSHSITQAGDAANFGCTPFRFNPPDRQPESDSDTKLLMLRETTGSSLSDNSSHNHSLTNNGSITAGLNTNPFLTDLMFFPQPYGRLYDFSIEYFAKFNQQVSGSTTYYPIVVSNTSASTTTLQIMHDSTTGSASKHKNYLYFGSANSGTTLVDDDTGVETTDTSWHHYLLQRTGNQLEFYRGGALKSGNKAHGGSAQSSNQLDAAIGDKNAVMTLGHDGGSNFSRASVSNFRIKKGLNSYTPDFPTGSTSFDGVDDWLSISASNDFDISDGEVTYEGWVYFDSVSSKQCIWEHYTDDNNLARLFFQDTGVLRLTTRSGGTNLLNATGTTNFSTGTWYHIAVTRSTSGDWETFINGTKDNGASGSESSALDTSGMTFYLGVDFWATDRFLDGNISNFRIVKGTRVYTSNFTVPTGPLTAITNTVLLTCQNTSGAITDSSSSSHSITVNSGAAASSTNPFGGKQFTPPTDVLM